MKAVIRSLDNQIRSYAASARMNADLVFSRSRTFSQQPNAIEWRSYGENAKNRLYRRRLEQDCRINPVMLDVIFLRAFGDRDAKRILPGLESRHLKAEFADEG